MTLKEAQKHARQLGFTIGKTSAGDYRLNVKGGTEEQAVYESTINDAVDTMLYIVGHRLKR